MTAAEGLSAVAQAQCLSRGQQWRHVGIHSCKYDAERDEDSMFDITGRGGTPGRQPYISACDEPCAPASSSSSAAAAGARSWVVNISKARRRVR